MSATAEFPVKLQFLFEPHRYKVAYGGRGAAKSWGFARALLIIGAMRPLRVLCARETQKSISDSVHRLLSDQIDSLGLQAFYRIEKARIIGINGTEFIFAGLKHNIKNIKSVEACDVVWVEEAQTVSKTSWEILIPTIRKDGSEIWVTFNPELEDDDTYKRFVLRPPPGCVTVKINFNDNPWFPPVLKGEMNHDKERDPDAYLHVWEGHCKQVLEGAIYAKEMRAAKSENRITRVPYNAALPVHTFWDLGWSDKVAIWFAQSIPPGEFHLIDYQDGSQEKLSYYLGEIQKRGYIYGQDYLPHDANHHTLAAAGRSIREQMKALGRDVRIVRSISKVDGINATRTVFPQCWFDEQKCSGGLDALRRYRYAPVEPGGTLKREPLHDEASNGADAFRMFGVSIKAPATKTKERAEYSPSGGDWMS